MGQHVQVIVDGKELLNDTVEKVDVSFGEPFILKAGAAGPNPMEQALMKAMQQRQNGVQ